MYGRYDASVGPKMLVTLLHAIGVAAAVWFLLGGSSTLAGWFGVEWHQAAILRRGLLIGMSAIYFLRVVGTSFVMLKRKMAWSEAATIGIWVLIVHGVMAVAGGTNGSRVGLVAWIGIALYLMGSFLNTGSEYQRKRWKEAPEHKGKLYTGGLFKYSMHINYFGDMTLFTGFALATGRFWALVIPLIMAALFIFVNIPMLDGYLAKRYGSDFEAYSARTAKFIPFVW